MRGGQLVELRRRQEVGVHGVQAVGGVPDPPVGAAVLRQPAVPPPDLATPTAIGTACTGPLGTFTAIPAGRMAAELDPGQQIKDPCVIAPDARYRGVENQLYRVEIHQGGLDRSW